VRIGALTKLLHKQRKWVLEVLVVPSTETIPRHDDVAAEMIVARIKSDQLGTFLSSENWLDQCVSELPQRIVNCAPVKPLDPLRDGKRRVLV
jgi:hypothetical protein